MRWWLIFFFTFLFIISIALAVTFDQNVTVSNLDITCNFSYDTELSNFSVYDHSFIENDTINYSTGQYCGITYLTCDNCTYGEQEQNQTTETNSTQCDLSGLQTQMNEIQGGFNMIAFVILWLGLWGLGYYAIQTKNDLLGGTMIILTIPLDIYFSYKFQEVLLLGTGFMGVAFSFMAAWTLGVFVLIRRNVGLHKS